MPSSVSSLLAGVEHLRIEDAGHFSFYQALRLASLCFKGKDGFM
jgi:hypothetical protein